MCVCVYCVCVCACVCMCVCVCAGSSTLVVRTSTYVSYIRSLSYEEQSVKKSPTGEKGIVQCSFKNGLPGRGEHIIISY